MKIIRLLLFFFCFSVCAQSNWQSVPNIFINTGDFRFDDVHFLNENVGWAVNGFHATVYKTTDGGLNWTEQFSQTDLGGNYYFRNIEFINENIGFLGTLDGSFFKTINGGQSWLLINNISPNPQAICGLTTIGSTTIYGCGAYFSPAYIIKSIDSGNTWQYIDMSAYANALVEVSFSSETDGFACGRSNTGATILKTTDGGQSWTEIYNSNIQGEYVWKIQVLESNPNFIFGSVYATSPNPGKLLVSSDAGTTWNSFDAPETEIQAVGFTSTTHGWMGGHNTGFYETTDGGQSWTNLNIGSNLNKIFILNSSLAYASGSTIYKYTDEALGFENFNEENKKDLNIEIQPNPVKNNLEFSVDFESADNILIELYDATGKQIKQLHRDIITTKGLKYYSFNVSNLSAGIYIIDFHNNTGRTSKKFIKL
jgi:photosystem II stability/assembly factor-like uncharacterized protein